jgi:hypothetical protein
MDENDFAGGEFGVEDARAIGGEVEARGKALGGRGGQFGDGGWRRRGG